MKKYRKVIAIVLVLLTGVLLITGCNKGKNTKKGEKKDTHSKISLLLNTNGMGQVSYYIDEERKQDFNDENPIQQIYTDLDKKTELTIDAKADAGWKFIKWTTEDGKKYSDTSKVTLTVDKQVSLIAVFDSE